MNHFDYIDRIKREDAFIRNRATGTAEDFAKKMGVSRRTIFSDLDLLRSKGADISFNKSNKSYIYQSKFSLIF